MRDLLAKFEDQTKLSKGFFTYVAKKEQEEVKGRGKKKKDENEEKKKRKDKKIVILSVAKRQKS